MNQYSRCDTNLGLNSALELGSRLSFSFSILTLADFGIDSRLVQVAVLAEFDELVWGQAFNLKDLLFVFFNRSNCRLRISSTLARSISCKGSRLAE